MSAPRTDSGEGVPPFDLGSSTPWEPGDDGPECVEWCPICRTADIVRGTAPEELRGQWNELQREALLTLRAALDHYLGRLDRQTEGTGRVEEIPIE